MKRLFVGLGIALTVTALFGGCGISENGGLNPSDGGGGVGGSGGTGVAGGTCFPGSKVCTDPKTETLVCLPADSPTVGCKNSTGCEPCVTPHATATCAGGKCAVKVCDSGFADCNSDPIDGCEVDLDKDPTHCGSCVTDCIASKGTNWMCDAGKCAVNDCVPPTTSNCDGDKSNGCEVDLLTDVNNCSYCTHKCELPNATSGCSGTTVADAHCTVVSCNTGYADCNGNPADGCEININTDSGNCGACGTVCTGTNGQPGCSNGACGIVCNQNFENCDGNPANGCEVNLTNDLSNCGSCNNVCPTPNAGNGTRTCNGACGITCNSPTPSLCSGGCFDLETDSGHCGACGTACTSPKTCQGGSCTCPSGQTDCGGTCYDLSSNNNHCGTCNTVCSGGKSCQASSCTCQSGQTDCSGTCTSLKTDPNNCQTCGHACGPGATCSGGVCSCGSGSHYCSDALGCKECCVNPDCGVQFCCTAIGHVCGACCSDSNCPSSEKCCNGAGQSFTCIAKSGSC